jgi:hypothetical protein
LSFNASVEDLVLIQGQNGREQHVKQ